MILQLNHLLFPYMQLIYELLINSDSKLGSASVGKELILSKCIRICVNRIFRCDWITN